MLSNNRMTLADLLSMQQDNSDPSVHYSTGQPTLSSLTRGRTEEEINQLLSGMQIRSPGFNPNFMSGEPYMPPQQMPQNYVQRGNNAPIDMDQRQPMPQNYIQRGNNAPIDLGQSQRQHDVYRDGPQVIRREQMQDGRTLVTQRVAAMDGDGRQTTAVREIIETPDYLNPTKLKELEFQKKLAELAQLRAKPQLESPQQKLANEIIAAEARSKLPYTTEGARLAEQKAAAAKAAASEEGKPLPISAASALMENQRNLRRAQEAQALLNGQNVGKAVGDKDATGWKGYAPDAVLQRMDPQGIDTRAAIADLGSLVIHDRSGAAVTALEFPRLQPFIPSPKDDPATARKKLNRFVMEYQNIVDEQTGFYKESGYKVPTGKLKQADVKRSTNDGIPPMETWVERAKELNPDMSGAQIEAEYMKKYRR